MITPDNGIQDIRRVGHKERSCWAIVHAPHLRPVVITSGPLGGGLP
jgi:large repetitive protein